MKLFFAGARDHGMVRQPVLGMEALHLLQAVGAVYAATDADCPGLGHDQSAEIFSPILALNGYPSVAHAFGASRKTGGNLGKPVKTLTEIPKNHPAVGRPCRPGRTPGHGDRPPG